MFNWPADDFYLIKRIIASHQYSEKENVEDIRDSGIALAAEAMFQNYNQVEVAKLRRRVNLIGKVKKDKEQKYRDYHNFEKSLDHVHSYQFLALQRAEKEKAVKISFAFKGALSEQASLKPNKNICDDDRIWDNVLLHRTGYHGYVETPKTEEKQEALKKARSRLKKMCERMWRRLLKEMSEEDAITAFSINLNQKMLTPPLRFWQNANEEPHWKENNNGG